MESTMFMESTVPELLFVFGIIVSLSVARSTLLTYLLTYSMVQCPS